MSSKSIQKGPLQFLLHASIAAFGVYFCMYAFRKPFTAASFEGYSFFGIDYKISLVISQVIGYALSKFIGIRKISELLPKRRMETLIGLILMAEISLFLFSKVKAPYNLIFMFLNGIPLGLIWGIVFSYLEGRKYTDLLGVALCSSFILSSGLVKSVGLFVMQSLKVDAWNMPWVTGAIFFIPLCFFAWLLERIPLPQKSDIELRSERLPMSSSDRKDLFCRFLWPLIAVVVFYTFLTAFRDFRDNFARELWDSLGFSGDISVYSISEILVAFVVLFILGSVVFIRNNFKALKFYHSLMLMGLLVMALCTLLFQYGYIAPFSWMVATGFGLYICYVPFNSLFFDRYIAAFHIRGNSGFLIYIADAFGYAGSVLVLFYKNFGQADLSWLNFFIIGTYSIVGIGIISLLFSIIRLRKMNESKIIQSKP